MVARATRVAEAWRATSSLLAVRFAHMGFWLCELRRRPSRATRTVTLLSQPFGAQQKWVTSHTCTQRHSLDTNEPAVQSFMIFGTHEL